MEHFDIIIKGTRIADCILARQQGTQKVLVVDDKQTYDNYFTHEGCVIERIPRLLRKSDPLLQVLIDMNVHVFLDFVLIKHHLYFKLVSTVWDEYEIPTSKSGIASCAYLAPHEKFLLNRLVGGESAELCRETMEIFTKAICGRRFKKDSFMRFGMSFGDYYFLYPVYGYRDVSENMSRFNAINGVVYLMDKGIEIVKSGGGVILKSQYGNFEGSGLITLDIKHATRRIIKVVNVSAVFHHELFYGVFDNGVDLISCICLSSVAKICPEGTYLIYLWKEDGDVTLEEIKQIGISAESIVFTVDVECDEDFKYDVVIEE